MIPLSKPPISRAIAALITDSEKKKTGAVEDLLCRFEGYNALNVNKLFVSLKKHDVAELYLTRFNETLNAGLNLIEKPEESPQ